MPFLLQDECRTFLTFFLREVPPDWDGTYVRVRNPGDRSSERIALVEFERCIGTKMGYPDEDAPDGHPLSGKGLVGYRAMSVKNSPWLKELETVNSVDSCGDAGAWRGFKHYILPFHDSTFECIAGGFKVEVFQQMPLSDLLAEICQRL